MLHLVHQSPYRFSGFTSFFDLLKKGDVLLLYQDAVLAAQRGGEFAMLLKNLANQEIKIFALQADVHARGIEPAEGIEIADYDTFVELVVLQKPFSWHL